MEIEKKQVNKIGAREMFSLYLAIVASSLLLGLFKQRDEITRYTSHATFKVRREGMVGDSPRWDFYYSTPVIGNLV